MEIPAGKMKLRGSPCGLVYIYLNFQPCRVEHAGNNCYVYFFLTGYKSISSLSPLPPARSQMESFWKCLLLE